MNIDYITNPNCSWQKQVWSKDTVIKPCNTDNIYFECFSILQNQMFFLAWSNVHLSIKKKQKKNSFTHKCHISQNKCEDVFNSMPDKLNLNILKYFKVLKNAFITALEATGIITK